MAASTLAPFNQCLDHITCCPGWDDYDHRPYVTTNESMQSEILADLAEEPLTGDAIIGVSCFCTLNVAAFRGTACSSSHGEIKNIILLDRSKRVEHFWEQMKGIIGSSSKSSEVICKVADLLKKNKEFYYGKRRESPDPDTDVNDMVEDLITEAYAEESWLCCDEKFAKIKKIFNSGHFIFKRIDLCDKKEIESVSKILKERNITIDTIYLSNVVEYIDSAAEKETFIAAMKHLISPKTLVVHTRPRKDPGCPLDLFIQRTNGSSIADLFPHSFYDLQMS